MEKKQSHLIEKYLPGRQFEQRGNALLVPIKASELGAVVRSLKDSGLPFMTPVATDEREHGGTFRIYYVFAVPAQDGSEARQFIVPVISTTDDTFPSIAREFPDHALYEREIMTMKCLAS